MEKIREILENGINSAVISQKKKGIDVIYNKVQIKPYLSGDEILFQFSFLENKKVSHKNCSIEETAILIEKIMREEFLQCIIFGAKNDVHITSFSNKIKFKSSKATKNIEITSHDKKKNYIINLEDKADFLLELGVITKDGKIKNEMYNKFRQINKYLEFIDGMRLNFPKNRTIRVVDFGCGKAYLSFALYYFLTVKLGLDVEIIGLDLKEDVVKHCQQIAENLGYEKLNFQIGDIGKFTSETGFDMVISLHACDTATDMAINKGVKWKSKAILAVPCCQHELNPQLKNEKNHGVLRYGLMRERLATLITDTSRALLLESVGYSCEVAEFIETEHTPKNVLLKAVYTGEKSKKSLEQYNNLKVEWNFTHTLEELLR